MHCEKDTIIKTSYDLLSILYLQEYFKTLWSTYYPHFTDKKTESQNLPKLPRAISDRARIWTQVCLPPKPPLCFQSHTLKERNPMAMLFITFFFFKKLIRASLVAQWLRVCLPMQGTWVRALVWEDPTCRGAAGPVSHNYWACASGACAPQQERPRQWEARTPRWRVAPTRHN